MKHFMVCINPECEHPVHPISDGGALVATVRGIPVIHSITGDEPTLEDVIVVLEELLESDPEDVLKDLVYDKLKQHQDQSSEECTCQEHDEAKTDQETLNQLVGAPVGAIAEDDYYRSPEYKAHRIRMDELEVKRVKAEIEYRRAETRLMNAKAQDIEQHLKLSGSIVNTPKTK